MAMSRSAPSTAPKIIAGTRSGRPKSHTIPAGRRTALAPPKVAAEMTVCSRFWRAVLRNRRVTASGSRPTAMAMTAAMIELFGVIPTRVRSSIPITAPSSASPAPNSSVPGSKKLGCRLPLTSPSMCGNASPQTAPARRANHVELTEKKRGNGLERRPPVGTRPKGPQSA